MDSILLYYYYGITLGEMNKVGGANRVSLQDAKNDIPLAFLDLICLFENPLLPRSKENLKNIRNNVIYND